MKNTQILFGDMSLDIEKNQSWPKYLGALCMEEKVGTEDVDEL